MIEPVPGEDGGSETPPAYQPGEVVTTKVCELEPGSEVTASLEGAELGSAIVGSDGCANVKTTLPANSVVGPASRHGPVRS